MNLTRIDSPDAAAVQHVADALTLLPYLPPRPHRLADAGSGGGVPGIPLAIVRSDVRVTLIEATGKKARFLEQTARELRLTNIQVVNARLEDAAGLREAFDVVVARALAPMDKLARWCLPLVRVGGALLAMKGPRAHGELAGAARTIARLGGRPAVLHPVDEPNLDGHIIAEVRKAAI